MAKQKVLYAASTAGHLVSFHLPYLKKLQSDGLIVHGAGSGGSAALGFLDRWMDLPFKKSIASPGNFALSFRLARRLRREKYDLILVHTSLAAFFVRLAVMLAGKGGARVVNTVHGYLFDQQTPFLKRTLLLLAEKLVAPVTDRIVTMNRQDTQIAKKRRLCRGDVIEVPGMGVDAGGLAPPAPAQRAAARESLRLPEDAFVLVYAAEFSERKNQMMLISALKELPERAVLLLPGRGGLLEDCRKAAEALGLASRVIMPGFVEDIARCYRAADLCVSASRSEGLPFNLMEAMFCGLPCVASRVKGHEDLIRHGENGLLFPFGDSRAFVAAVAALMEDGGRLSALGENAAKSAEGYALERVFPVTAAAMFE